MGAGMGGMNINSPELVQIRKSRQGFDPQTDPDFSEFLKKKGYTTMDYKGTPPAKVYLEFYKSLTPEKLAEVKNNVDPKSNFLKETIDPYLSTLDPSEADDVRSQFNQLIPSFYSEQFGNRGTTTPGSGTGTPNATTPSQPTLPNQPTLTQPASGSPTSSPAVNPEPTPTDQSFGTVAPGSPDLATLLTGGQQPTTVQPNLVQGQPVTELPIPVPSNPDSILLPSNNPQLVPGAPGAPITQPNIDQQQITQSASQQQKDYIDALNRSNEINQNALAQYGQILSTQTPQLRGALEEALAKRKTGYSNLQNLLVQNENQQLGQLTPQILEDLNSRGLLASSELGNALAREKANLTANTTNQLAQYGIGDIDIETQGLRDIATNQAGLQKELGGLGFANQQDYAANSRGATDITNAAQQAGLQRRFSLEDYQRELKAAKELGANITPNIQPSGGTNPLGSALAGAGSGALIGSAIPGVGTAVGAGVGGLTGLFASKTSSGGGGK